MVLRSETLAGLILHRANTLVEEAGAVVAGLQHIANAGPSRDAPVEVSTANGSCCSSSRIFDLVYQNSFLPVSIAGPVAIWRQRRLFPRRDATGQDDHCPPPGCRRHGHGGGVFPGSQGQSNCPVAWIRGKLAARVSAPHVDHGLTH